MYIRLDKEYEIKCNLGTIREIEKTLGKGFFEIMESVAKLTTEEQLKMLFAGVKRANAGITFETFYALCEEHIGMGDLMEYLEKYFYALQYPGLSEEEVQQKIQKAATKQGDTGEKGMNWTEIIRNGALCGLTPNDIWELELWEYNAYVSAYEERGKIDTANAIMTGYYAAYYTNAGKKAKSPQELINKLYERKQSVEEGLRDIERFKKAEQRSFEDVSQ